MRLEKTLKSLVIRFVSDLLRWGIPRAGSCDLKGAAADGWVTNSRDYNEVENDQRHTFRDRQEMKYEFGTATGRGVFMKIGFHYPCREMFIKSVKE